jgi:hypothetical protein
LKRKMVVETDIKTKVYGEAWGSGGVEDIE